MAHQLAPRAAADLDDIWYYVATEGGSLETADRLIETITDRFLALRVSPISDVRGKGISAPDTAASPWATM